MTVLRLTAIDVPIDVTLVGTHADAVGARAGVIWSACSRALLPPAEVSFDFDTSAGEEAALSRLTQETTVAAINARMGRYLMIHAGAVDMGQGRVAAFFGPSGAGKTTLTRGLGGHFGYVTDETLAIDASGQVIAYPKPLSIVNDGTWVKRQASPSELGLHVAAAPLGLSRLAMLARSDDGPVVPEVRSVETLEAITMVAPQVSGLGRLESPLARLADAIEGAGGLAVIRYRDSSSLLPLVQNWATE